MSSTPSFHFSKATDADLERFVDQHLSDLLEQHGFSRYRGNGRRWHRANQEVILSVQFVLDYSVAMLYFGFQPVYFPFRFIDGPMRLHDRIWTYFEATVLHFQALPEPEQKNYISRHLFSPGATFQQGEHYRKVLEENVFPILDCVTDNSSCHAEYRKLRNLKKTESWDPRWLLECISLGDRDECCRIAKEILPQRSEIIPMTDDGWNPTVEKETVIRELNDGDYTRYRTLMEQFSIENRRRLKRAHFL